MKKIKDIEIHIVPQKCGYYHSADDFWLSYLKAKRSSLRLPPEEKTALICEIEKFLTKER